MTENENIDLERERLLRENRMVLDDASESPHQPWERKLVEKSAINALRVALSIKSTEGG